MGTPADVYELPGPTVVAGFVGTSILLAGSAARDILGMDGTFTVRPEKIRLAGASDEVGSDEHSALGRIREVVYLGADTRYIVALDAGGELVVTQQNLQASSMEALAAQGRAGRPIWTRQHELSLTGRESTFREGEGAEPL